MVGLSKATYHRLSNRKL